MNYVQYEHPIESEVVELEEDIGADSLVDVDQVDGVLETPGNYEFVRIKEGPQFHDVGRKYRMIRRQPAKTFFCHQCNKEIKYPSKIAEHLRKHTGEKPYLCHICGVSFSQGHVLKVHLRGHHGERPYKCSYCVKAFTGLSQKKSHEKTHFMSVGGISCLKDDDQPINSTSNMTTVRHVFACPIMSCGMQSEQKREVEDHITLMHSDVQEWVEEEYTHDTYDSHMNAPIGDSAEEQQYDYYPFEGEVVIEEKPETSHLNGDASNPLSMDAHDTDQQNHNEEMFPHETYEYVDGTNVPRPTEEIEVETSSNQMVIHQDQRDVMLNSGVDEIVVDEGGHIRVMEMNMGDEVVAEERVRVLADPRPPKKGRHAKYEQYFNKLNPTLEEVEIDAATLEMAAPVRHLQQAAAGPKKKRRPPQPAKNLDWIIDAVAKGLDVDLASPHNRRKPMVHECEYCGRIDKYPSKIQAHRRTHTGEKPYKCEICGMAFAQRTPMRLHVRRHLDQKPYVCMIGGCTQRFVSGALLNIHQQTKHFMTKKYVCMKGCGRYFASARNQRNHEDRCLYNKDAANDIDDAIYQQLMYNDEEDEPEDTLRATQSQYVVDDPETLIEAVDMNISAHPQFLLH